VKVKEAVTLNGGAWLLSEHPKDIGAILDQLGKFVHV
jgi:hypothetical protein